MRAVRHGPLRMVTEYDQLTKFGMSEMDIRHGSVQRDRIAYDGVL